MFAEKFLRIFNSAIPRIAPAINKKKEYLPRYLRLAYLCGFMCCFVEISRKAAGADSEEDISVGKIKESLKKIGLYDEDIQCLLFELIAYNKNKLFLEHKFDDSKMDYAGLFSLLTDDIDFKDIDL